MPRIFEAGDLEGYAFAFDAAANALDWRDVAKAAEERDVNLTASMAMLFVNPENYGLSPDEAVQQAARLSIHIPQHATADDAKRFMYAGIRQYIGAVGVNLGLSAEQSPHDTVALLEFVEYK